MNYELDMTSKSHPTCKILIKQCSGDVRMCFLHDRAHTTWVGHIFISFISIHINLFLVYPPKMSKVHLVLAGNVYQIYQWGVATCRYKLVESDPVAKEREMNTFECKLFQDHSFLPNLYMDVGTSDHQFQHYTWSFSSQIYAGGKLVFCDNIFNGYGNAKRDFQKQLLQSRQDASLGNFLPPDFKFK